MKTHLISQRPLDHNLATVDYRSRKLKNPDHPVKYPHESDENNNCCTMKYKFTESSKFQDFRMKIWRSCLSFHFVFVFLLPLVISLSLSFFGNRNNEENIKPFEKKPQPNGLNPHLFFFRKYRVLREKKEKILLTTQPDVAVQGYWVTG